MNETVARQRIDAHVGSRLTAARTARGKTQTDLARMLGMTFQQIQKYEKGSNRVSASVLYTLTVGLKLPSINYFFEGLPDYPGEVSDVLDLTGVDLLGAYQKLGAAQRKLLLDVALNLVAGEAYA